MRRLFLIMLLMLPIVQGAGIGPARRIIDFVPGTQYDTYFYFNADDPGRLSLRAEGSAAPYIDIQETADIEAGMNRIPYTLSMPRELKSTVKGNILVTAYSDQASQISAHAIIGHQVWIVTESVESEVGQRTSAEEIIHEKHSIALEDQDLWLVLGILLLFGLIITGVNFLIAKPIRPHLKRYVRDTRRKGFSDQSIREKLLESGWSEETVNKVMKKV